MAPSPPPARDSSSRLNSAASAPWRHAVSATAPASGWSRGQSGGRRGNREGLGSTTVSGEQPRPGWRSPGSLEPPTRVCGTNALSAVLTPAGCSVGRRSRRPGSLGARSLSSVPKPCLLSERTSPESGRCGWIQEQKSEQRELKLQAGARESEVGFDSHSPRSP